ncbi:MAG: purine-nucleoside phosphorylase [Succinivibrionaceae bacterium]|nr:purine-nucleoside phosphorylase [Succinivibrionaceae bacterium]
MSVKNNVPTPHIEAGPGEIAGTILLPGDPLRAKFIAGEYLSDVHQFNSVRNMLGFTGTYEGKRISVMGTGMGCPSIGIYSYELIHFYGVKNLIRVGTAGSISPEVKVRDLVFGMGACTTSNFPALMDLPGVFAPVCSFDLLRRGVDKAEQLGLRYAVGNILTSDMFYGPAEGPEATQKWASMGVLAIEMEAAALYTNAAFGGANALTVLTVSDHLLTGETTSSEERRSSFTDMMKVALSLA